MTNHPPFSSIPRFHRYPADHSPGLFVPRFQLQYHAALTNQACPENSTIKTHLQEIVAANLATDLNQYESALHFDNCTFDLAVERINNLWQLIESNKQGNRYSVFGAMIHTVQDFYAHSNWIELHENQSPVPIWNLNLNSLPMDIVSGTFEQDNPKKCGPNAPTHTQLNKDSPTSENGRKTVLSGPNQGKTLFDLAFASAVQATKVQFSRLVAVIG
jgi:hypothetical protein